jgi:hypothetical protein
MTDTLKSICEQCVHLRDPQLEFISEESQRQKQIILRDVGELFTAASHEHERTVVLLAGSLFEAVLYSFIQSQSEYIAARRGEFTFDPEHSLDNFVGIFNRWFSDLSSIPDSVVAYRNTIHINRELQFGDDICGRAARELLRQLDSLLGAIAA